MTADVARRFVARVGEMVAEIADAELQQIDRAAGLVADAVTGDHLIHLFGSGHSQLLGLEGFFRAGGLACVNPVIVPELAPQAGLAATAAERDLQWAADVLSRARPEAGDALIIFSNSGVNAVPVEVARRGREAGVRTVGIAARRYMDEVHSRHPDGLKLEDVVDVLIDNHGLPGDAILEVTGMDAAIGPTSTITGALILHAILAEAVVRLVGRGISPPIYVSSKLAGADARNAALVARYRDRVALLSRHDLQTRR